MNKNSLFAFAAQFAPRLFQVRRSTWITAGVGLLVLLGLLLWAALVLIGWVWGQAQNKMDTAPEAARGVLTQVEQIVPGAREKLGEFVPDLWGQAQNWVGAAPEAARGAIEQAEQAVPGVREKLGALVPALKPAKQPQRDVSGADLGPVVRYPGFARTYWDRKDKQVTVEYEGEADFAAVLDHYVKGFATQGFEQAVQSAAPAAEIHEYAKGRERFTLNLSQKSKNGVSVRIETTL